MNDLKYTVKEFFYDDKFKDYPIVPYIFYPTEFNILTNNRRRVFVIDVGNLNAEQAERRTREIINAWRNDAVAVTAGQGVVEENWNIRLGGTLNAETFINNEEEWFPDREIKIDPIWVP